MAPRLPPWVLVATLTVAFGCGDDAATADGGPLDGAADGAPDTGRGAAPPEIPWLEEGVPPIMIAACPEGWREVAVDGVTECDPYPEGGPTACAAGDAHFPGEPTCQPVGDPCPTGDYHADLPTEGRVVYVNADAPAGGDGSLASPYAALSQVSWISISAGATVAIARGTYEGTLPLRPGARVVGACARETIITGIGVPADSIVSVTEAGDGALVRNVTIGPAPLRGVQLVAGRSLILEGVIIEDAHVFAVDVVGADAALTLRDVLIRNTVPLPGAPRGGLGIVAGGGARIEATRLLVTGNQDTSISADRAGTTISLTDAVVRGTSSRPDGTGGRGISVVAGARLDATRMVVEGNHELGIFVGDEDSALTLTDSVVRDTRPRASDAKFGSGIAVESGAQLDAERILVADNHHLGLLADGAGTTVTLTASIIRDTASQASDSTAGRGINVQLGARLDAAGLAVVGNREVGVFAVGAGTTATLTDAVIQTTAPLGANGESGRGLSAQDGARVTATRLLVAQNRASSVIVDGDGATMTLADAVIRNTLPQLSDDAMGRGINVQLGGRLEGDRVWIDDTREFGLIALIGAFVDLRDVAITDAHRSACTTTSCPEQAFGHGAAAVSAGVRLTRFDIHDVATCGAFLAPAAGSDEPTSLDLQSGTISMSAIGACAQVDGYDLDRLSNDVDYRDNGANLDATTLPVPQPIPTIGG